MGVPATTDFGVHLHNPQLKLTSAPGVFSSAEKSGPGYFKLETQNGRQPKQQNACESFAPVTCLKLCNKANPKLNT